MDKKMEAATVYRVYMGIMEKSIKNYYSIYSIYGLYGNDGNENRNYTNGLYRGYGQLVASLKCRTPRA